jgi:hypothetical protein
MAEPRTPRELNSREKTARMVYTPPSTLPDPKPEPGYVYRWVATHVLGQAEPTNVSMKLRDGWEPVKASDHPELMLLGSKNGNVEIGGLMLCKMSKERAQSRDEYYAMQARAQMEAADNNFMRNNDPRMPLFADKKSSTTRGVGFGSGN